MKAGYVRENELPVMQPAYVVPSDTSHQHLQRVEEWTHNSTSAPPSNRKYSKKERENHDLEKKSQLIAEAVELLDNRERKTRSRLETETNEIEQNDTDFTDTTESVGKGTEGSQYYAIGKHFRNSRLSARNYVKHFEMKMHRKKVREDVISGTYPSIRSRKKLTSSFSTINGMLDQQVETPGVVLDSWRKASRSVKFSVNTGSRQVLPKKSAEDGSVDGEKWAMKQENDREWWRWKLKQRFLQNDELLHKLASQRQKLEQSSMFQGGNNRLNRNLIFNNKRGLSVAPIKDKLSIPTLTSAQNNSSWHVSIEIPSHMTPSTAISKHLPSSSTNKSSNSSQQVKARDPIPNFYTPSKQVISALTNPSSNKESFPADPDLSAKQKLKTLRKDPYLSKLLAGNEMFRPEMMLEDKQQNRKQELSQNQKTASNTRRKISLESLTDTDDELIASKFFDPDVKVLYERLSEMEVLNSNNYPGGKSKLLPGVSSREPSDGYLNLPILLQTGRFNRYNKLPSMKLATTSTKRSTLKQQTRGFDKNDRLQSALNKMKNNIHLKNIKLAKAVLTGGGAKITEPNVGIANQLEKIENLPTSEWAKKLVSKIKRQDTSTTTDDDGALLLDDGKKSQLDNIFNIPPRRYKVPIDQETNLLYHEILMSKWKKEKHNENTGGKNNKNNNATKLKRGEQGRDSKRMDNDLKRPRGLDIWLENIREKAKRDRVISPLPNNAAADGFKVVPTVYSDDTII